MVPPTTPPASPLLGSWVDGKGNPLPTETGRCKLTFTDGSTCEGSYGMYVEPEFTIKVMSDLEIAEARKPLTWSDVNKQ